MFTFTICSVSFVWITLTVCPQKSSYQVIFLGYFLNHAILQPIVCIAARN